MIRHRSLLIGCLCKRFATCSKVIKLVISIDKKESGSHTKDSTKERFDCERCDGQKEDRSRFSSNAFADHSLIRIMMMGVIMEEHRESLGPPKKVKTYFRNAIYALIVFGLRAPVQTEDRRTGDERRY